MALKKNILALLFVALAGSLFAITVPQLTAPVMDTAGIVDDAKEAELNTYLMAVSEQTGVQIAVLTLSSLGDEALEDVSMQVARAWGLGQAKEDNGALLTVALEEHALRIETGYGLEGLLTDTKCGLIIRNAITPQFKNGNYTQGIVNGVMQMVSVATEDAPIDTTLQTTQEPTVQAADVFAIVWFIFIVLLMITTQAGVGPLGLYWWLSLLTGTPFVRRYPKSSGSIHVGSGKTGFSSSSFHSSGFSGGHSFSGGGGHFGGGGASGRW